MNFPERIDVIVEQHSRSIPAETNSGPETEEQRLAEVCKLQQKGRLLEAEIRLLKAIQQTLAARASELSDFLENAPHAMHTVDAQGTLLWANQFELDLLGYARSEYIGRNAADFYANTDGLARIMTRLREGTALNNEPARVICKDGSIRDVLITSNARWENGAFIHSRCFMRDVTDQQRELDALRAAEERAEHSQAFLAAIIESSDDAIVSKSLDGRIKSWNRGAERLFGYSADEVIGKSITIIIPPELQYQEQGILARIVKGERIEHFETVRVAKDGRRIDVSLTISPILDRQGRVIGASKSSRDITDRKRAEEALRTADRRKNEFLAMLGHELRNPLAPIRNVTEMLRRTGGGDTVREPLYAMLERQVQQMTRLLDDLLDVGRITQGKIKFQHEMIDFQVAIVRAVEASGPFIERRRHRLSISVPDGELPMLGDMARLVQMITNLLNNAAKYTPEGGAISLSAERSGTFVEIRVKDNGGGIAPEMLPRVFDLFVQADPALRQSQDGMGIGLTLVKSIVEHHGGSVRAVSAGRGQGSEFIVRLPMVPEMAASKSPRAPMQEMRVAAAPRRVLLVDDNRDLAESLAALLRSDGHEVSIAPDGPAALRMVQAQEPDLALIDIGLPGMSGYEVAQRLRAMGCVARLVAVTGFGGAEERERSQEAGFDAYFVKPIDPDALDRLVASEGHPMLGVASD
jgi:PAS domain S-box-containing protein